MQYIVQDAKYRAETISAVISFANVFSSGEVITGTPVVTISVLSGIDPTPSDMLYGGVTVTGGDTVEQRFRLGVLGCIYEIVYEVVTNLGNTISKNFYLAILPNNDAAVPLWLPLWETTQLYPYQPLAESAKSFFELSSGSLIKIFIDYSYAPESAVSSFIFSSGDLHSIIIPYSYEEAAESFFTFSSGSLTVVVITYPYSSEDAKSSIAITGGTLVVVVISYSYTPESATSSLSFTGGTL